MKMPDLTKIPSSPFAHLSSEAQAALARISALIESVVPTEVKKFKVQIPSKTNGLFPPKILQEVASWSIKGQSCLYTFNLFGDVDTAAVRNAFANAKNRASTRRFSKFNHESRCLYVGSSGNLGKRFKEHLGYGSESTYALQIVHWAPSLFRNVEFVAARYPDTTTFELLQVLEDALWNKQQPMFGKRGGK